MNVRESEHISTWMHSICQVEVRLETLNELKEKYECSEYYQRICGTIQITLIVIESWYYDILRNPVHTHVAPSNHKVQMLILLDSSSQSPFSTFLLLLFVLEHDNAKIMFTCQLGCPALFKMES